MTSLKVSIYVFFSTLDLTKSLEWHYNEAHYGKAPVDGVWTDVLTEFKCFYMLSDIILLKTLQVKAGVTYASTKTPKSFIFDHHKRKRQNMHLIVSL